MKTNSHKNNTHSASCAKAARQFCKNILLAVALMLPAGFTLRAVEPILAIAVYKPVDCDYRLVFRVPAAETNMPLVVGTNIYVTSSAQRFDVDVITGDSIRVSWQTQSNQTYRVLLSTNLTEWQMNPMRFKGDGSVTHFDDTLDAPKCFYRVLSE